MSRGPRMHGSTRHTPKCPCCKQTTIQRTGGLQKRCGIPAVPASCSTCGHRWLSKHEPWVRAAELAQTVVAS